MLSLEFRSSEQIWRFAVIESNQILPNTGLKTQAAWLPLLPRGGSLSPHLANSSCQCVGKALLGGLFSGAFSLELGPS